MTIKSMLSHCKKIIFREEALKLIVEKRKKELPCPSFDYFKEYKLSDYKKANIKQLIAVDGIGCSGSSAMTDYLAEFSTNTTFGGVDIYENPDRGTEQNFEVDFFRNPNSVLDLERIAKSRITRIQDFAIKKFIETVNDNYLHGPNIIFHNENYLYYSKEFISSLIDFTTKLDNQPRFITKKITVKEYRALVKDYISNILSVLPCDNILVMDNLISIGEANEEILNDYFMDNTKLIFVWRDPRDIYAQARMATYEDFSWVPVDLDAFVKWYTYALDDFLKSTSKKILVIRFEDFVTKYDLISKTVNDFLGLDEKAHNKKFVYFNPKVSVNNIGIWKKYVDSPQHQQQIEFIEKTLKDYCFY